MRKKRVRASIIPVNLHSQFTMCLWVSLSPSFKKFFSEKVPTFSLCWSFCDTSGDCAGSLLCSANKCTTYMARCSRSSDCDSPYVCKGFSTSDTLKKCRRKASTGEYCELNSHCLGADSCRNNVCKSPSTSPSPSPTPSPSPMHQAQFLSKCSENSDCGSVLVCRRYSKNDAGSKRCRQKSSTGEYCEINAHCLGTDLCNQSNKCDELSEPSPNPQSPSSRTANACERNTDCKSPNVCRYKASSAEPSKSCQGKSNTGQYCGNQAHCLSTGDTCTGNVCTSLGATGASTTSRGGTLGAGPIVGIVTAAAAVITAIAGAVRAKVAWGKSRQNNPAS